MSQKTNGRRERTRRPENTPKGGEHDSMSNDSNITYDSDPINKCPEPETNSAKAPEISTKSQHFVDSTNAQSITKLTSIHNHLQQVITANMHQDQTDAELKEIIQSWPKLPRHIRATLRTLVKTRPFL